MAQSSGLGIKVGWAFLTSFRTPPSWFLSVRVQNHAKTGSIVLRNRATGWLFFFLVPLLGVFKGTPIGIHKEIHIYIYM